MQTTSPELSIKLQELGVPGHNNLWWCTYHLKNSNDTRRYTDIIYQCNLKHFNIERKTSLYTLDEILEVLPASVEKNIEPYYLNTEKGVYSNLYRCGYFEGFDSLAVRIATDAKGNARSTKYIKETIHINPAEAAGELLAWCIENGYVDPSTLNN
jgi:hypothetical protein